MLQHTANLEETQRPVQLCHTLSSDTEVSEVGIQEIITNQHPLVLELLKVSNLRNSLSRAKGFSKFPSAFFVSSLKLKYLSVPSVHGLTGRCPFISIHLCR